MGFQTANYRYYYAEIPFLGGLPSLCKSRATLWRRPTKAARYSRSSNRTTTTTQLYFRHLFKKLFQNKSRKMDDSKWFTWFEFSSLIRCWKEIGASTPLMSVAGMIDYNDELVNWQIIVELRNWTMDKRATAGKIITTEKWRHKYLLLWEYSKWFA